VVAFGERIKACLDVTGRAIKKLIFLPAVEVGKCFLLVWNPVAILLHQDPDQCPPLRRFRAPLDIGFARVNSGL
jgi:hypothetical protein